MSNDVRVVMSNDVTGPRTGRKACNYSIFTTRTVTAINCAAK
jgi:hypothetical protein